MLVTSEPYRIRTPSLRSLSPRSPALPRGGPRLNSMSLRKWQHAGLRHHVLQALIPLDGVGVLVPSFEQHVREAAVRRTRGGAEPTRARAENGDVQYRIIHRRISLARVQRSAGAMIAHTCARYLRVAGERPEIACNRRQLRRAYGRVVERNAVGRDRLQSRCKTASPQFSAIFVSPFDDKHCDERAGFSARRTRAACRLLLPLVGKRQKCRRDELESRGSASIARVRASRSGSASRQRARRPRFLSTPSRSDTS